MDVGTAGPRAAAGADAGVGAYLAKQMQGQRSRQEYLETAVVGDWARLDSLD